jgi:hypothetical protein
MNKPITVFKLIKNKKAFEMGTTTIMMFVLVLLLAGALIAIINPGLKKSGKVIDSKLQCSGLTFGGTGECKAKCEGTEQALENAGGCPPKDNSTLRFCCLSMETNTAEPDATDTSAK